MASRPDSGGFGRVWAPVPERFSAPPDAMKERASWRTGARGVVPSGAECFRVGGGQRMNSVGIDLDRKRSQVEVVDDAGGLVLSRRIDNEAASFLTLLGGSTASQREGLSAPSAAST